MDEFSQVAVSSILVGERFRKEFDEKKMQDLAESIREFGLLEPIVIDRELNLLAGERRLRAHQILGLDTISAKFIDQADDTLKREIELEENVQRADLSWQEVVLLRNEIHRLKTSRHGEATFGGRGNVLASGWSQADTAESLGVDRSMISKDIYLGRAMELVPELADANSRQEAEKKLARLTEALERELELRERDQENILSSVVWHGDCCNLLEQIETDSVDCIITDPPYAINYDSIGGSAHRTEISFDDSPEAVLALLRTALKEMRRVLKPSGHLYAFFGIQIWQITMDMYRRAGFDVDPIPLVWVKNKGGTVDFDKRFQPVWEPILFSTNKERRLSPTGTAHRNVFYHDVPEPPNHWHANQKPLGLLEDLISLSTDEDDLVLDPFCGSGSTLVAAKRKNRRYLGIELDEGMVRIAKTRLSNNELL